MVGCGGLEPLTPRKAFARRSEVGRGPLRFAFACAGRSDKASGCIANLYSQAGAVAGAARRREAANRIRPEPWGGVMRRSRRTFNPLPTRRSARPAGSPLGSCRTGAGLSSQTAALRPLSSSRRSGASRARRRTPEWPPQTPRSGYRPRRTMEPPRRRIRRVGSHCGNLGPPPPQHLVSIKASAAAWDPAHASATGAAGSPT